MNIENLFTRPKQIFINRLISPFYSWLRILKYKILSTCNDIIGKPICIGPVLIKGLGQVIFKENATIGVVNSPGFYNTYCYIEARNPLSVISIGDGVYINNNACIISEGEGIFINSNVLIGPNFTVFDSDFHEIDPLKRISGFPKTAKVEIGVNVLIGANVTILKGVNIGKNTVIGSNSVVSKSIPGNVIAAGNPCMVIKNIVI